MWARGRPISRSTAYRSVVSRPAARSARVMTSRMTGPRRLPTCTVPDGVFESLTTCGPETRAASSSAHSMVVGLELGDGDDLVRDVASGDLDRDVLALLVPEERSTDGTLVADPALGRLGLGRADDGERLRAIGTADLHRGADLDVVVGVVLVDE